MIMGNWAWTGKDLNNNARGSLEKGYFVNLPGHDPATYKGGSTASGYFQNKNGETLSLWLTRASIDFKIGGSYGQSKRLRQWFPRNLVQPVWSIQGICPNSFQLQRLGEYIRQSQLEVLNPQSLSATEYLRLFIYPGNLQAGKGPHNEVNMFGYVHNFKRGAERFKNAPAYEFEFMVLYSYGNNNIFNTDNASPQRSRFVTQNAAGNYGVLNDYTNYGAPTPTRPKS